MRRFSLIILAYLLASFSCLVSANHYKVNVSDRLNVRESPSKSAPVISVLFDGDIINSTTETLELQNNDGVEWATIQLSDGRKGYVAAEYLTSYEPKKPVKNQQTSWAQRFLDWFENLISLKWCFIIIIVLAVCNYSISRKNDDEYEDFFYVIKPLFYILMNLMLVLTYFSHGLEDLVDHHWTGGWLDGYVMVFVNAVLLGVVMLVEHRCFVDMSWSLAHKFVPKEKWRKFKPARLFWILPLLIVGFFTMLYLPIVALALAGWGLYYIVRQMLLFHPRYDIALIVFFFSIFSCISCAVLIYTFFWSLVLGFLAICFLSAAPQATSKTIAQAASGSSDETPVEDETEYIKQYNDSREGELSWNGDRIYKKDGTSTRITSVNEDGTVNTSDGGRHEVDYWKNTREL